MEQFIYQEASQVEDRIKYGIFGLVLGLIESFLLMILLGYGLKTAQGIKNLKLESYYKKYLRDTVIETFRGIGRIAVGLLLIFPGFKRMVQYYLIPFIVQFDAQYAAGKVDVLSEAENLLKDKFLPFAGLLLLTQIVTFVLQILSVNFNLFTTPLAWILFYLVDITFQASVFWIFYNYYVDLKSNYKED